MLRLALVPIGLLLLATVAAIKPRASYLVWAACVLVLSSESVWTSSKSAGVGLRIAGLSLLLLTALPRPSRVEAELPPPASETSFAVNGFICGIAVYVLFSTIPHGEPASLAFNLSGLVALFFATRIICVSVCALDLQKAIIGALSTVVASALILGLIAPGTALAAGRLRGPFFNANALGFAAMLLILATLVLRLSKHLTVFVVLLGGAALVWSASRSSAVGLTVGLVVFMLLGKAFKPVPTMMLSLLGIAVLIQAHFEDVLGGLKILRLKNSRTIGSDYALSVFHTHQWTGIGQGREAVEIASTPLRALAHGGILALVGVSVGLILLLSRSLKAGPGSTAVVAAGIAVSFFEGWPLSGWSPGLWIFVIVFAGIGRGWSPPVTAKPRRLDPVQRPLALRGG